MLRISSCLALTTLMGGLLSAPAVLAQGQPPAGASAAPVAPAPAPPAPAAEPSAAAPAAPPASAWDQAIQKSSQQEHALETDEERQRREERLGREVVLSTPPTGRLGVRLEAGGLGVYRTSGAAILGGAGIQVVHPFGRSFELAGALTLHAGLGKFVTYGPILDVAGHAVVGDRWTIGLAATLSAFRVEGYDNFGCYGSFCGEATHFDEMSAFGFLGLSTGFYLDAARRLELGLDSRFGSEFAHGGVCYLTTVHFTYLWSLWGLPK